MSPMNTINILALAVGALAVPYHGHGHVRHNQTSAWSSAPYATTNATVMTSSGTDAAATVPTTTTATLNYASTSASTSVYADSAVGSSTWSSTGSYSVNPVSDSVCAGSTVTVTTKAYVTVTVPAGGASSYGSSTASVASSVVSPVSSAGRSTRTVTSTVHITNSITLPASGLASMSANSTTSSSIPVYGSISLTYSAPAEITSSTEVSPVQSSSSSWAIPSLPVESSSITTAYDAPTQTSAPAYSSAWPSLSIPAWSSTPATSSAAATSSTASSSGTGKRGVAYNDASLTTCFLNNPAISWAYNWGSTSTGLNSAFNFIPTLWGTASEWTNSWNTNAEAAIAAGSTHLFSFNEADMSSQSNLSPADAAAGYKTYMQPFAGKAKLCAPSVSNGGGAMGLDWLAAFLEACTDCTIDCVNVHWYDSAQNPDYFKSHVQNATDISGGKPVFVSEFGATGSDDEVASFLGEVMPWMDGQSFVEGYAYFMVSDGRLVTGSEPSVVGKVYAGSS